jgi:hypothetical protein
MPKNQKVTSFVGLMDDEAKALLTTSGSELIKKIDIDTARKFSPQLRESLCLHF